MSTFCLDSRSAFDATLQRMITGYEYRDFLNLCCYAAETRTPAFVPAARVEHCRLSLRLTTAQWERRLTKWSRADIALIEWQPNGTNAGLLITYLLSEDEPAQGDSSARRGPAPSPARAPNADRQADWRARQKALRGQELAERGQELPETVTLSVTVLGETVTPAPSGRNAGSAPESVTSALRPSRAGQNNVQRYPSIDSPELESESTLNVAERNGVTPASVTPASSSRPVSPPGSPLSASARAWFVQQAIALARELRDIGSEARYFQLAEIADRNGLDSVITDALNATRRKMASRNPPDKPGAYFDTILIRKLRDHSVTVPTKADLAASPPEEVRRLIEESMASVTPLEAVYGDPGPPSVGDSAEESYIP